MRTIERIGGGPGAEGGRRGPGPRRTAGLLLATTTAALMLGTGVALANTVPCPGGQDVPVLCVGRTAAESASEGSDTINGSGLKDLARGMGGDDFVIGNGDAGIDILAGDEGAGSPTACRPPWEAEHGRTLTTRSPAGIFVPMTVKVLFVCAGNICRSPVAQGVFEDVARREGMSGEIEVDSAGTHGYYHAGGPPDPRAQQSVLARGIDISGQRARLLDPDDCRTFDYVLTMDEENYRTAAGLCNGAAEVRPFLDYAPGPETEVPDPYFGGPDGFQDALDLIERASEGLLQDIRKWHLEGRA